VILAACGPDRLSIGDDEVVEEDDASSVDVPPDLLDNGHVLEIEGVPADLEMIALGAVTAFQKSEIPQRCPHPDATPSGGNAGRTPAINVDCNEGPNRRCVPAIGGGGAGYYDSANWTSNPVWSTIGFEKTEPHCFHYDFTAANDLRGSGSCSFTAQAFADLDADLTFSTYELRGSVDENGSILQALFVDLPYE
jgi:hypothetical protein